MNASARHAALALLTATGIALPSASTRAGTLGSFEADALGSGLEAIDTCLGDPVLWDMSARILFYGFAYGGVGSWSRMDPLGAESPDFPPLEPREPGEGLIPLLRVDVDYQWLNDDVEATAGRLEAGFGPFAFQIALARLEEEEPDDELDLTQWHLLYRMSLGGGFEVDLGAGQLILEGEERTRWFSFTVPVLYHPIPGCGLEFRPAWADTVSSYSLGGLLGTRFVSFSAGYRWLCSPSETLHGPYAGLSIHF